MAAMIASLVLRARTNWPLLALLCACSGDPGGSGEPNPGDSSPTPGRGGGPNPGDIPDLPGQAGQAGQPGPDPSAIPEVPGEVDPGTEVTISPPSGVTALMQELDLARQATPAELRAN